ncbi:TD and POZ domain-containing protein 3 [Trichonephila clavata]|uniref:TD and POZ domain-containing protein 3 n=1 Tax=Trichonephila clavata TaxID=2740835 RepID=A0A8X6GXB7_TRICU|nr:TD and POZ domain-containing protein 3 [Trichonephila clavata]
MSCTFTKECSKNSILTIHRESAATQAMFSNEMKETLDNEVHIRGFIKTYNSFVIVPGKSKAFKEVFEPNCKSKLIHLGFSIREHSTIEGKVFISEKKRKKDVGDKVRSVKEEKALSRTNPPSTDRFEPLKELSNDFALLLNEKTPFADVQLKCGSITIPAHKVILSTRSPVFRAMFSNEMKETLDNEVHITDIDVSVLQAMLTYVYTGQTGNLSYNLAGDLLFAADKYELKGLKIVMIDDLKSNVSVENVLQLLVLGDLHAQDLKAFAMDFMRDKCTEFSMIENTEEWQTLAKERSALAIEVLTLLIKSKEKK